jgi:hypothetical protein
VVADLDSIKSNIEHCATRVLGHSSRSASTPLINSHSHDMSESLEASTSTSAAAATTVQDDSSHSVNGTNGNDGPSKPRARLGPVETVTLQEFDPDSDSEEEEEDGEAHIEEIEPQSEDFLKDHPDDTDVCSCYVIKARINE